MTIDYVRVIFGPNYCLYIASAGGNQPKNSSHGLSTLVVVIGCSAQST